MRDSVANSSLPSSTFMLIRSSVVNMGLGVVFLDLCKISQYSYFHASDASSGWLKFHKTLENLQSKKYSYLVLGISMMCGMILFPPAKNPDQNEKVP